MTAVMREDEFQTHHCVVLGAGGFIGGHLVNRLVSEGAHVVAVDIKPEEDWYQINPRAMTVPSFDVARGTNLLAVMLFEADEVYNLAADMGGIGYIEQNKLDCMLTVKTSVTALEAADQASVRRFFYSSSACVYPGYRQNVSEAVQLKERHAYPADAEDGYGWEKLFTERLCRHFSEDRGLTTRIARYHNVYGPFGAWEGGREKAPAAICRKVALAAITGDERIEIWGDGLQMRSYMYIDDCIDGTLALMRSDYPDPVNIGSAECVSVNDLVSLVEDIAGVTLQREYWADAPQGVRGRSSDNTLVREVLGWEPSTSLRDGMEKTYAWVYDQVKRTYG